MKLQRSSEMFKSSLPFDVEGVFAGLCRLAPGETFPNHFHTSHEEVFFVVSGVAELWTGREHRHLLEPGDIALCERGEQHFLRNVSDKPFVAYFTKSPNLPQDRVNVEWMPNLGSA